MNQIQSDIAEFMRMAGQDTPTAPTLATSKTRELRAKLILEEALETIAALGVTVSLYETNEVGESFQVVENIACTDKSFKSVEFTGSFGDLALIADGVADTVYVAVGTAVALGIDMTPIWRIVQRANMAKFGPGGYRREDGKWMKPADWKDPQPVLEAEIESQVGLEKF